MGNQLLNEDDELVQGSHPGCMSGFLHALVDYHQWNFKVKKMLLYRKQDLLGHGKRDKSPRITWTGNDSFEVKKLSDAEANQRHVDQISKKSSSTNKKSLRARIRALVSEQEHHKKGRVSRLKRTVSIHHLEPSADWRPPIIFLQKNTEIGSSKWMYNNHLAENHTGQEEKPGLVNEEAVQEKKLRLNASDHEDNQYVNILEMFKVNKDQFQNVVQNTYGQQCLNTKARLTKSGSFPAAYSSNGKNFRPAKLEHKQTENYSFPKSEKLVSDTREPKLGSSRSGPLFTDGSGYERNTCSLSHIRRISSLRESTDKYSRLLESSSSRLPKLHMSKSLRLINENEIPSNSHASILFRRFLSVPHLENSSSAFSQEFEDENGLRGLSEEYIGINYEEGPDYVNSVVVRDQICPKAECSACTTEGMHGMDYPKEQVEETSTLVQQTAVFIPESCFEEDVKINAKFQNSEGTDSKCNHFDKNESEVSSLDISSTEILQHSCHSLPEKFESATQYAKSHEHIKPCVEDDADFIYVRDVLEISGFIKNGLNETWYSSDHPLDPCLFEELEYRYPYEPEFFEDGITALSHHLLLFDLVDEVLFDLFERSYTYYPNILSSSCHIRPVPTRDRFLDEVWANINKPLRLKAERKQSLDLNRAISQDLGKDDGWMNLQFDSESVELELEDLILDKLLGEIFCC